MVLHCDGILPFTPRQRSLEGFMLSEVNQAQKINPARAHSCVKSKTFKLTDVERTVVFAVHIQGDVGIRYKLS